MSEHATKYCRTTEAIAGVLGIELYAQRKRRAAQLAEILGWTKRPDFPKRHKGAGKGWLVAEVDQWGYQFATVIAEEKRRHAARADAFNSHKPRKETLAILGANGTNGAQRVRSQRQMAVAIAEHFGCACEPQYIQNWLNGKNLPVGAPRFPKTIPGTAGEWEDVQEGLDWYEQHVIEPSRLPDGQQTLDLPQRALVSEYQKKIHEEKIKEFELEALRKSDDKNFITRAYHLRRVAGFAMMVNSRIDGLERICAKAFAESPLIAALPPATRQPLLEQLREIIMASARRLKAEIQAAEVPEQT